ncbi:hypothetical protein FKM82_018126 [Ascaphus truei]
MALPIHFVVDPQEMVLCGSIVCIWLYNTLFVPKAYLVPPLSGGTRSKLAIWTYYLNSLLCVVSLREPRLQTPGKLRDGPKDPVIGNVCKLFS